MSLDAAQFARLAAASEYDQPRRRREKRKRPTKGDTAGETPSEEPPPKRRAKDLPARELSSNAIASSSKLPSVTTQTPPQHNLLTKPISKRKESSHDISLSSSLSRRPNTVDGTRAGPGRHSLSFARRLASPSPDDSSARMFMSLSPDDSSVRKADRIQREMDSVRAALASSKLATQKDEDASRQASAETRCENPSSGAADSFEPFPGGDQGHPGKSALETVTIEQHLERLEQASTKTADEVLELRSRNAALERQAHAFHLTNHARLSLLLLNLREAHSAITADDGGARLRVQELLHGAISKTQKMCDEEIENINRSGVDPGELYTVQHTLPPPKYPRPID
ncbi:hypothetical protein PLICRDRAFT_179561 [Plicaturopsis crispa FD-325 SS-3]|uniref:Uncharacterized protein n=1 Tax=Plicaturopsis crispa FD-325 SS-3 TaxID=944288 RepID=A0A0C9T825_PLICR|nr:hypothetical protein PLICRDRAFT_179561 [Plicaturopsis crispa FD-325 SS-3]